MVGNFSMRYLIALQLTLFCSMSWAGVLPDSAREVLVKDALSGFWGIAKLSDGSFVQPDNEQERKTLPISTAAANQVLDVGEVSGLAALCGLDWKSHYLSMTAAARRSGFNEKQVAFIGLLHGTAQGAVFQAMKSKPCGSSERAKVLETMQRASNVQLMKDLPANAQAIDFARVTCVEFKKQMTQNLSKEFGLNVWFWAVGYWAGKNGKKDFDQQIFGYVTRETGKACDAAPQQLFIDALLSVKPN